MSKDNIKYYLDITEYEATQGNEDTHAEKTNHKKKKTKILG